MSLCIIFIAELQTPVLNYTELSVDGDVRNVRVNWTTPDNTTSGIEYVLSINNSTEPVTSSTLLELSFLAGVRYELTVVSQLCQGNLQSNSSNKVDIFFPGMCVLCLEISSSIVYGLASDLVPLIFYRCETKSSWVKHTRYSLVDNTNRSEHMTNG